MFPVTQDNNLESGYKNFLRSYNSGDLLNAEQHLLLMLESIDSIPLYYKVSIFNNLGATNFLLGKYDRSLDYYNKAESLTSSENISQSLGDIYINKAIIFGIQKLYSNAFEYFEKGIRIYDGLVDKDKDVISSLSLAYMNYGRILTETGEYQHALQLFNQSASLISRNKLPSLATVYMNIARVNVSLKNFSTAEIFFTRSIELLKEQYSDQHYRLAEAYSVFAQLMELEGKYSEAYELLNLAHSIYLQNYGEKSPQLSLAYKNLGDHFLDLSEPEKALTYYQKALISIVNGFNNTDVFSNPPADSSLFKIRFLENLKAKALAMEKLSGTETDPASRIKYGRAASEAIGIALKVIEDMKDELVTSDNRTYLAENEKDTYINAIEIIKNELDLTGEPSLVRKMYEIAQNTKASVLRDEITENELFYSAIIPDSLHEKKNDLELMINTYNNFINNELQNQKPDSAKINLWKDQIFAMNRKLEMLSEEIYEKYPEYSDLLHKTMPMTINQIMKGLKRDETIIDFLLAGKYKNGVRRCFSFIITRDTILIYESELDSLFVNNTEIIQRGGLPAINASNHQQYFSEYTAALNYMYNKLIEPVQKYLHTDHLIIIPDEEIVWLPFDALIESFPSGSITSFEGLPFLINKYIISYGPSSSMIFNKTSWTRKVYAFLPDYSLFKQADKNPMQLSGATKETDKLFKWFRGSRYTGESATEANFRTALDAPGIFHLAMHSISDTLDSKYSYLLFDSRNDTLNDGMLFNYEISLLKVASPMIVLSSCNSGIGKLYHSEGLMSLARSFFLSGAASVIMTSWEINDEVSADIMSRFYYYLAKGEKKDDALHHAKIDFLNNSPPSLKNPYYWAAYKVLGNNNSVTYNRDLVLFLASALLVIIAGITIYFFRRRRISPAESL